MVYISIDIHAFLFLMQHAQHHIAYSFLNLAMPVLVRDTKDPSSLARLWECEYHIRERLRLLHDEKGNVVGGGKLIHWPDPKNKAISMDAIALNIYLLKIMARWWRPTVSKPKSPNIKVLKEQA